MISPFRLVIGLCLLATSAIAESDPPATAVWAIAPAGQDLPEQALLAIGLVALDPGIVDAEQSKETVALRRAEALYIPFFLRTLLEETRLWGAVRFLPTADRSTELLIGGRIVKSSGDHLAVHFRAIDSTGRLWLDREYSTTVEFADYENSPDTEPFMQLYQQVAADLEQFRATLPLTDLERIIEISRLAYAAALAPDVFNGYLKSDQEGRLRINRLPAKDDPMWARIERTRDTEYLFIDAVDLQFAQYYKDLAPTYTAWRRLTLESRLLIESYRSQSSARRSRKGKNSAAKSYRELQELKLYQLTLREAIVGFEFEVGPTTLDLDGEVVALSGSLAEQHDQWKGLLSRIYAAQLGLPLLDSN